MSDQIVQFQQVPLDTNDMDGWTPLHVAAFLGRFNAVESLVQQGASLDSKEDEDGWTALHLAVSANSLLVVK